ncbi:CBS domain-containing protein, partial [Acidithiobacillus ferrooxidans]|nr:CBS domain-containing protein [Acidithiobacillus ferrooxidans]
MKTAQDIMNREVVTVLADDPVDKVGDVLLSSGHHS